MKKRKKEATPKAPICPYCGRRAVLRDAGYVYKTVIKPRRLYVCPGYPVCDSYVGVHDGSLRPEGSMANGDLRNLRIRTHRSFDRIWRSGVMSRNQAYRWMRDKLALTESEAHIGHFSDYYCNQLIAACDRVMENQQRRITDGYSE